jgi:hypothetical protein
MRKQEMAITALNKTAGKIPIPLPYQVGDQVWLEATHLCLPYQSSKLAPKCHGPFSITKGISPVTYQLHLPMAWNIHNVFHAFLLSPYHKTRSMGQTIPDLHLTSSRGKKSMKWSASLITDTSEEPECSNI